VQRQTASRLFSRLTKNKKRFPALNKREVDSPVDPGAPAAGQQAGLVPVLGFRALLIFYFLIVFGPRLLPLAASVGPGIVVLWGIAFAAYCVPLALTVIDLSSRFPDEGGIYVWSKRAFGDFHGYITAWTYWTANLAYFPSLLLFGASQSAFVFPSFSELASEPSYLISWSIAAVIGVFVINVVGLRTATWFNSLTAVARIVPAVLVIALGLYAWVRVGSATDLSMSNWVPRFNGLSDLFFLSTLAYLFAGFEGASTLSGEIKEPRRNIPRALLTTGLIITGLYVLMSLCFMVLVPASELDGLEGFADAVGAGATRIGGEQAGEIVRSVSSAMLALTQLGSVSVWFAIATRLPFVVGLDHYLPRVFGRLHPRFHTPWVSCLVLAMATAALILLSGFGGRAAQIYNILISIEIVIFFIPNLYLFATVIKLRHDKSPDHAIRIPGGGIGAWLVGGAGFIVTAASLGFALIPSDDVESTGFFYASVLGSLGLNLAIGIGLFLFARWRQASHSRAYGAAAS
jgi:amino acid transporter